MGRNKTAEQISVVKEDWLGRIKKIKIIIYNMKLCYTNKCSEYGIILFDY